MNKLQQQSRKNISKLRSSISKCIDTLCEESDYEISFAEINAALIDSLRTMVSAELQTSWESESNSETE